MPMEIMLHVLKGYSTFVYYVETLLCHQISTKGFSRHIFMYRMYEILDRKLDSTYWRGQW